jgi:hypothetical protein
VPTGTIECTSYALDSTDVITWVDDGFRRFAEANGASELGDAVVGRELWDFVDGVETRELLRILFDRARLYGPISFPYRCDSAAAKRSMVLDVSPEPDGRLTLVSRLQAVETRRPVPFFERSGKAGPNLLRLCSWCNRVAAQGVWVEPELGVSWMRPFEREAPRITHGICPSCLEALIPDATADAAS